MTSSNFQLEKNRDFGELFNDTFLFIKYNFMNLLKGILYFVIPFALLQGIAVGIGQHQLLSSIGHSANPFAAFNSSATLISYLFMLLTFTFLMAFVYQYMKLYKASEDKTIELQVVWKSMLGVAPKIFFAFIIVVLLSIIGFILFVIPGIYIMVCFSLVVPIIVFQGDSIGEAISSCFALIKNNWWLTFGFLIVLGIIAGALQFAFQLPAAIYQGIATFHMAQNDPVQSSQSLSIIFGVIQSIGSALMQAIPFIGMGILYFSLIEQKENPALLKDLESVGANE